MTQVLEYITQNYTLFLFGAIIILLAVIGYYAEKTNFGQGKVDKTKNEETNTKEINLENTRLMDVTNNNEDSSQTDIDNNIQNSTENLVQKENDVTPDINSHENITNEKIVDVENNSTKNNEKEPEPIVEKEKSVNPIIDAIHRELNLVSNDVIYNVEEIKKTETKNKKSEEAFNKFSDEFDALLPKKEIISDDLLSEIDDLELGKTQKFNLKDFKKFDNIKLPRISDSATEDQDIWKF